MESMLSDLTRRMPHKPWDVWDSPHCHLEKEMSIQSAVSKQFESRQQDLIGITRTSPPVRYSWPSASMYDELIQRRTTARLRLQASLYLILYIPTFSHVRSDSGKRRFSYRNPMFNPPHVYSGSATFPRSIKNPRWIIHRCVVGSNIQESEILHVLNHLRWLHCLLLPCMPNTMGLKRTKSPMTAM